MQKKKFRRLTFLKLKIIINNNNIEWGTISASNSRKELLFLWLLGHECTSNCIVFFFFLFIRISTEEQLSWAFVYKFCCYTKLVIFDSNFSHFNNWLNRNLYYYYFWNIKENWTMGDIWLKRIESGGLSTKFLKTPILQQIQIQIQILSCHKKFWNEKKMRQREVLACRNENFNEFVPLALQEYLFPLLNKS